MDLSNRCRAADVAAGCRRHLGRPAGRRPPSLPLLAATAAGGQLNKPAQTREEGGREDGARAEEEAPAPASIVRSVAVVRPYEVRPSVRFFGHHRRRFTPSIAPPLLRCLPLSHRVGAELQ